MTYKTYIEYFTYLGKNLMENEKQAQNTFLALLFMLYIFWLKEDIISILIVIIISFFILHSIYNAHRTRMQSQKWTQNYRNQKQKAIKAKK
jgi:hypothetical protein